MTDDIHDLFASEEADESDGQAEAHDEESDEPDSEERAVFPSLEHEGPAEPAEPTPDGSPRTSSEAVVEDESAEHGMDWSATSSKRASGGDVDEPGQSGSTTSAEDAVDGDSDDPAMAEPTPVEGAIDVESTEPESASATTSSENAVDEDPGGSDPSGSTTAQGDDVEEDGDGTEPTGPTTPSGRSVEDESGEPEPAGPRTPAQEAIEDDGDAPESATATVDPEEEVTAQGGDDFEPAVPTEPSEASIEDDAAGSVDSDAAGPTEGDASGSVEDDAAGSLGDDRSESEPTEQPTPSAEGEASEPEPTASRTASAEEEGDDDQPESASASTPAGEPPAEERGEADSGGATASAGGATPDDRGTTESTGGTIPTDGPSAGGRDEFETGSPDEPASTESETAVGEEAAAMSGSKRLPTGIDELDSAMGGGIPPGRLVVLVADPGVQSELIVDSVLAQRDTLYVTTDRPEWEVMKDIEPGLGSGEVVVRDHTPDSLLSSVASLLDELGTSSNFVLDSVNELELVPRKRYRVFLSDVKRRLFETGSVGLLTGVTVGHESARDLTLRRADVVWRLETRIMDRDIENRLTVPKFRGGAAMTETVMLELTDEVRVDTSWNEG